MMKLNETHCPGGSNSQTGNAVRLRHPQIIIKSCKSISVVEEKLISDNSFAYTIPIWNSNQGEIKASEYVWNLIEDARIWIHDLWPKSIQFWLVEKEIQTHKITKTGKVGSVVVAEAQCSKFLDDNNLQLIPYSLTTEAFDKYKAGDLLDGVLVAPGQGDEPGYRVKSKNTANSNNFTSFVIITSSKNKIETLDLTSSWLTGVTIGNLSSDALDDEQSAFFENMFMGANSFDEIPKLIFVFKRTDKVGLLFEGEAFEAGDYLDAELVEAGNIIVHDHAGQLDVTYTDELFQLVSQEFKELNEGDFILHRGKETVLFTCPALKIYTHGFDEKTVEPVVRLYIDMVFELIDSGGDCSDEELDFFNKYQTLWLEKRADFIDFTII